MKTINSFDTRYGPCLHDWTVGGDPAVPVSFILELGVAAGEEVAPEGAKDLRLQAVRDVSINLSHLRHEGGYYAIEKEVAGHWSDTQWVVDVRLRKVEPDIRHDVARLRLVYGSDVQPMETAPLLAEGGMGVDLAPGPYFSWSGLVYPLGRWRRAADGTLVAFVQSVHAADLWSTPLLPRSILPAGQLENIVRAGMAVHGRVRPDARLTIAELASGANTRSPPIVIGRPDEQTWWVVDQDGRVALRIEGLQYDQVE
jgi:hypothetical protein